MPPRLPNMADEGHTSLLNHGRSRVGGDVGGGVAPELLPAVVRGRHPALGH